MFGSHPPRIARSFGESDRQIGAWADGTLETRLVLVSMHPKVVGIAPKLILGTIIALILTVVLWREEANLGGENMMAGHEKV